MIAKTFSNWMQSVNREIEAISGLGCNDLPDVCYRDMYDDDTMPREAALEVLESADYPTELIF